MTFLFPYNTCENIRPNNYPVQKYSFFVNILSVILLLIYLYIIRNINAKLILLSLLIFEIWHSFSHYTHLKNRYVQTNIVHSLFYIVIFSFLFNIPYIVNKKNVLLKNYYLLLLFLIILCVDLFICLFLKDIYMFLSGILLFTFAILINLYIIPRHTWKYIFIMLFLGIIIVILLVNESYNCEKMLKLSNFPYHVIIETIGFFVFWLISYFLQKLT